MKKDWPAKSAGLRCEAADSDFPSSPTYRVFAVFAATWPNSDIFLASTPRYLHAVHTDTQTHSIRAVVAIPVLSRSLWFLLV
jgi:hypothetical protein